MPVAKIVILLASKLKESSLKHFYNEIIIFVLQTKSTGY